MGISPQGGGSILLRNIDRLSPIQLQQKIIHLESELSYCRNDKETRFQNYHEQIRLMKQDNSRLKREMERILNENEIFSLERDELIKDYNELLLVNKELQTKINQHGNLGRTFYLKEQQEKVVSDKESYEKCIEELQLQVKEKDKEIEGLKEIESNLRLQLTESHAERELFSERCIVLASEQQKLEQELSIKTAELNKVQHEMAEIMKVIRILDSDNESSQQELHESEKQREWLMQKETNLNETLIIMREELADALKNIDELNKVLHDLKVELGRKNEQLSEDAEEKEKMGQEIQVLQELQEQLHQKNVSYQQKIKHLEKENHAAMESLGHIQTELSHAEAKLMELGEFKTDMYSRIEIHGKEMNKLQEENNQLINEKNEFLQKISELEKENTSFHESIEIMSQQRQSDEKRLDHITTNLNEVFAETKQLVKMTSSLKKQLETKTVEINQMKKEKELLMEEVLELRINYEKSEAKKNELENQIEIMKTELINAQKSLTRLEQFETEKLRLKDDLEEKIEEFNMLTDHYQREKDIYINVLEQVQEQVNVYKEKSESFDAEKGSWSKQIDELKTELAQTKATIVQMEELERKNIDLSTALQAKEIDIYKMEKDSERALQKQMDQFQSELKLYQDKIVQYEKDREIWEMQLKQMKTQISLLESSLEEKESFIKQYIKQPQPQTQQSPQPQPKSTYQNLFEKLQPSQQQYSQTQVAPPPDMQPAFTPPQMKSSGRKQPLDWFQRTLIQQQGQQHMPQVAQASPEESQASTPINNQNPANMDFFALRKKTGFPSVTGSNYGSQWNQE
jgi:chromosome segregation ATPase